MFVSVFNIEVATMKKNVLIIMFMFFSLPVYANPINCNKSLSRVEKKICNNQELKDLDARFSKFYDLIKYTESGVQFKDHNPEWKLELSHCFTEKCIKNLYQKLTDDAINLLLEQNPRYKQMQQDCKALMIPEECEVYAFDANGTGLNINYAEFAIDDNYETHVKHIKVNRPQKCVVLALSSFEPTVWKVYYTPGTQIYGVILAYNDDNQMLQGVPVGTKVWRNECLKGSVREAFISGLANNHIVDTKDSYIGKKLSDESYVHQSQNIDVVAHIQQELPNHQGVRNLVEKGILRPIDKKDVSFLIDRGYSPIDQWGNVDLSDWEEMYNFRCKDALSYSHSMECHHYILEKPLEMLPPGVGGVYGVIIFTPEGMTPPTKRIHATSSIMRMHATLDELNDFRKKN